MRGKSLEDKVLSEYGINLRELLENLYWIEGLSQRQIAAKLEVTPSAISINFKKYNIKKREHGYWMEGFKHSEESKRKISEGHKGKVISTEARKKMSEARKGKTLVGKYDYFKGVKKRSDGYIQIYKPDHPLKNSQGYVMEHRLVMEEVIGRTLSVSEEVHHINKKRDDNRPGNLHLFKNKAAHMYFHMMERYGEKVELKYEYK